MNLGPLPAHPSAPPKPARPNCDGCGAPFTGQPHCEWCRRYWANPPLTPTPWKPRGGSAMQIPDVRKLDPNTVMKCSAYPDPMLGDPRGQPLDTFYK